MIKENYDRQWQFTFKGKTSQVDLPHDYSITQKREPDARSGSGGGFFQGGIADYKKTFFAPEEWRGRTVMLEFEGIYMNATIRINHNIVATHPYGYTSFHCDLTPYIRPGEENCISVNVSNNALPNSRWYSGSGIYRHVWLMTAGDIHIAPYGIYVTTLDKSSIKVETTIENRGAQDSSIIVRSRVFDHDGRVAASNEAPAAVSPGQSTIVQDISISDAFLWSVESPYLYTLQTEISIDGSVIDTENTTFGLRTISVDVENGFRLNGTQIKMKGGCVHHDCGILGSAAFDRAEERKVELLKQSGFNAVRCAHNPPSPAFLNACDRLGMLVIDEAFDCWLEGKNPYDYNQSFEHWWQRDMASMILRDRNHPSVVIWSTGNEILERDGRSDGYKKAKELADFIRALDGTRPVTNALCCLWDEHMITDEMRESSDGANDHWAALTKDFAAPLDIVGYNYLKDRYEKDGGLYPGRVIAGTETFPKEAFDYWSLTEKLSYVIGDFVWTSLDYLGEAGIGHVKYDGELDPNNKFPFNTTYPYHQAYCGDIDVCGFKRPQSYYRDFIWGIGEAPYVAIYKPQYHGIKAEISPWGWPDVVNSWSWPGFEGKPIEIEVYSGGDEVELLLNGESLGRRPAGKANRYLAKYETSYAPGELIAITYENGVETYRSSLKTAGEPAAIRLTPDRSRLEEKCGDLSYVTVKLLDADGNVAHHACNELYFTVSGSGSLLAVGNGNPKSEEMYTGAIRSIHEGKAIAVVKSLGGKGRIVLTAAADGIPASQVEIFVG